MKFETEPFDQVLQKLEDFTTQNQLNEITKSSISSEATMYTQSSDPETVCPHCKHGFTSCSHCHKSGHSEGTAFSSTPKNDSPNQLFPPQNKTRYTQEDEEYLKQKYPDLHL
jgi:hypothetical protein